MRAVGSPCGGGFAWISRAFAHVTSCNELYGVVAHELSDQAHLRLHAKGQARRTLGPAKVGTRMSLIRMRDIGARIARTPNLHQQQLQLAW
jgi:hypothetical protein